MSVWLQDRIEVIIALAALVMVVFIAGFCLADDMWRDRQADCPTEDSCRIDYRDGGWVIEEVTP